MPHHPHSTRELVKTFRNSTDPVQQLGAKLRVDSVLADSLGTEAELRRTKQNNKRIGLPLDWVDQQLDAVGLIIENRILIADDDWTVSG